MKKLVAILAILIACVVTSVAQDAETYFSNTEAPSSTSTQVDKLTKAAETAAVQAVLKRNTFDSSKIASEEGKYVLFLARRMRSIVVTEAESINDVEYRGKLFKRLALHYLTILEVKVPPEEKSMIFEWLDSPLQVKFQEEPYRIDRDALYRWLSRRFGTIKENSL